MQEIIVAKSVTFDGKGYFVADGIISNAFFFNLFISLSSIAVFFSNRKGIDVQYFNHNYLFYISLSKMQTGSHCCALAVRGGSPVLLDVRCHV